MTIDVALLPADLASVDLANRAVVVLDVLRASTTMTAALAAGVKEIRVFGDVESARHAAQGSGREGLLCGEVRCLPPPGFELGNSPGAFGRVHAGRIVFMGTTNGTRAIVAAAKAKTILIGAVVNAAAVAKVLQKIRLDVTLLCAGTNGRVAIEDIVGAGAVIAELQSRQAIDLASDVARMATLLFEAAKDDLPAVLRASQGGRNVIAAGLEEDVDFAARLDAIALVGVVRAGVVTRGSD